MYIFTISSQFEYLDQTSSQWYQNGSEDEGDDKDGKQRNTPKVILSISERQEILNIY